MEKQRFGLHRWKIRFIGIKLENIELILEKPHGMASFSMRWICKALPVILSCSFLIFVALQLMHTNLITTEVPVTSARTTEVSVLVDTRKKMNMEDLLKDVQIRLPSLPLWSLNATIQTKPLYKNATCARYPSVFDLEFNNINWQTLKTSNGTFQLYNAYYDARRKSLIGPSVRILGMIDRIEPTIITYCQFWFADQQTPVFAKLFEYKYIWNKAFGNYKQNIYQPYLMTCKIPVKYHGRIPASVSVVETPCDNATNNLNVLYDKPVKKKGFAVCVKGLDFLYEDLSVHLVEWIELLNILGAEKIYFYELQVHPNISKVLKYYENRDMIHVTPLTLPGSQPNIPGFQHLYLTKKTNTKRQNEVIPYNDCLYKNLYKYKYIALLDIDEVIMPVKDANWKDLMLRIRPKSMIRRRKRTRASYDVRNVYFLDKHLHGHGWYKDIPKYLHMLQHVHRSQNFTKPGQYVKCFHNPERVLTLHNHYPFACIGGACSSYPIETADAQMQHYRADCVNGMQNCAEYSEHSIEDTTIWRYKEKLIKRSNSALAALGFFGDSKVDIQRR
ncbi:uncharacterized protein LOC113370925 [Ctenocephalides felis]|uniref:uncharacterized protein LOC113370925 n=1 Tax=Ctenocephalides felis TaxID=7515 RepID=UPI000E6E4AFC|nr:uncharacterized protein LOC113370925 [Ctenocephalides felis]